MERRKKILSSVLAAVLLISLIALVGMSTETKERSLLIGTGTGNLISYNDGTLNSVADISGTIHEIKTEGNTVYTSSQYGNKSILWAVEEQTRKIYSSSKKFHGFATTKSFLFLGFQDTGEIVKLSKSGEKLRSKNISGNPHQLEISDSQLYVGNINGTIEVYNKDLEREKQLKFGSWIGSFSKDERLLVAGRERFQVNTSNHIHTTTEGFVTSYAEGKEKKVRLGATFVPHGVAGLEGSKVAVTNMVNGTVAIVDINAGVVVEKISLKPRGEPYFTSLLMRSGDQLIAGDIEKDRIYFINPESGKVENSISITSLHSIYAP